MTEWNQQITLYGSETFCTPNSKDAYRVERGAVYVFIVEWITENGKGRPGQRRELCVASEGQMIPGFAYRDSDYRDWRFLFTPKGEEAVRIYLSGEFAGIGKVEDDGSIRFRAMMLEVGQ